jgi:hypothetical protein
MDFPTKHVKRDELKLGVPLEGDGFLISSAGFIVQDLEINSKAAAANRVMMEL